ncbi:class II aldolase/adducin family protein [Micromonospora sp. NBC_00389]|uniref:class II aldolase/adducin family protein n=1 Tax=Micromonospora sp. NBC_00389 TaxID=2903586 RepID=UPI002E24E74C
MSASGSITDPQQITSPRGTPTDPAQAARHLVALACRVLAQQGLAEDVLGHVSLRTEDGGLYVRCRGPRERGLLFTDPDDVHAVGLDDNDPLADSYQVPNELPIHREVLRARPDVRAVVHVHPPAVIAADLAGLSLRPIVGAYNIPAMRLAHEGIPVYPRGVLINRPELGKDVAAVLGDKPTCVLRAHGIVATGDSVQQAVVRALNLDALARITLYAGQHGKVPPELPADDIAELPDLGSHFNDAQVWLNRVARLDHAGLGL